MPRTREPDDDNEDIGTRLSLLHTRRSLRGCVFFPARKISPEFLASAKLDKSSSKTGGFSRPQRLELRFCRYRRAKICYRNRICVYGTAILRRAVEMVSKSWRGFSRSKPFSMKASAPSSISLGPLFWDKLERTTPGCVQLDRSPSRNEAPPGRST
jgi:hypothetical protein